MACHYIRNSRNMVSLNNDGRRSGGQGFFDGETSAVDTDDVAADSIGILGVHDTKVFKRIHTVPVICLLMLLVVVFELEMFLLPHYYQDLKLSGRPHPYPILVYSHAALWAICLLCDCFFRKQHLLSRTHGYLEFYRKTRNIRRLPLLICSGGCVLISVLTSVFLDFCNPTDKESQMCPGLVLSECNFMQIVGTLEMAVLFIVLCVYLRRTVRFNRARAMPDVQEEEAAVGFLPPQSAAEIGFRDETFLDDVLEKQADMIRYLKQHNVHLGKKIIHLQTELERRT